MNWHLLIPVGSYVATYVLRVLFPNNVKVQQLSPLIGTIAGVIGGVTGQEMTSGGVDPQTVGLDGFLGMAASGLHEHGEMIKGTRGGDTPSPQ